MQLVLDILGWVFIGTGCVFALIGAFGMVRLPDIFARCHGAGMIDTAGMGLILIGCMFEAGFTLVTVKLALIIVFILFTSPTTTYALARAALYAGVTPLVKDDGAADAKPNPAEAKNDGEDASSKT